MRINTAVYGIVRLGRDRRNPIVIPDEAAIFDWFWSAMNIHYQEKAGNYKI
jgi:hypothetical protein